MKKRLLLTLGSLLLFNTLYAQDALFSFAVKDIKGKTKNVSDYIAPEGITVFVFWKTCCPNNLGMLAALQEELERAPKFAIPTTFVLVSEDDARNAGRVRPVVGSYGWKGPVILDGNQEFARKVNIIAPPHWLAVDSKGHEVFRCKIRTSDADVEVYLNQIRNLKLN